MISAHVVPHALTQHRGRNLSAVGSEQSHEHLRYETWVCRVASFDYLRASLPRVRGELVEAFAAALLEEVGENLRE